MRQRSNRLRIILIGLLVVVLFIWGAAGLIARGRPAVTAMFPLPDEIAVPAPAPLRITFDRPMNPDSVEAALETVPAANGSFEWDGNTLVFRPDPPWPRGELITVNLSTAARTSGGIPLETPVSWTFKTAPTLLAFLWPADGPANLYAVDPQTGESVEYTRTEAGILDFSLAADGLSLMLSMTNAAGGADIASFDLLDRSIETVHACGTGLCRYPQAHPAGSSLAFEEITAQEIFLLQPGETPQSLGPGRFPNWSPEGLLLYYDPVQAVYVAYNPANGARTRYPNDAGEPAAWNPDGSSFIASDILEVSDSALSSHLMDYLIFSSEPTDRTVDPQADDSSPIYSPDGEQIAFARRYQDQARWTPGRQLWVMPAGGGEPAVLSDAPLYNHSAFAWHPDGGQLAYLRSNQADLNEQPEIWLFDLEAGSGFRLMINGFAPRWLP